MDYTLGDVLREVNNLRFYEFSLPPLERLPKGTCKSAANCVIAFCFPGSLTDGTILYTEEELELPIIIREFITDFDTGEWPSLIEKNVSSVDSATDVNSQTLSIMAS